MCCCNHIRSVPDIPRYPGARHFVPPLPEAASPCHCGAPGKSFPGGCLQRQLGTFLRNSFGCSRSRPDYHRSLGRAHPRSHPLLQHGDSVPCRPCTSPTAHFPRLIRCTFRYRTVYYSPYNRLTPRSRSLGNSNLKLSIANTCGSSKASQAPVAWE